MSLESELSHEFFEVNSSSSCNTTSLVFFTPEIREKNWNQQFFVHNTCLWNHSIKEWCKEYVGSFYFVAYVQDQEMAFLDHFVTFRKPYFV